MIIHYVYNLFLLMQMCKIVRSKSKQKKRPRHVQVQNVKLSHENFRSRSLGLAQESRFNLFQSISSFCLSLVFNFNSSTTNSNIVEICSHTINKISKMS